MEYREMNRDALEARLSALRAEYEAFQQMHLSLNMARGKPGKAQLELSDGLFTALQAGDKTYPCQAVFILRSGTAPDTLLEGLAMDGARIAADAERKTNLPGVFAAGDCIGPPYQVAKAVGDGNVAALSAARYLEEHKQ